MRKGKIKQGTLILNILFHPCIHNVFILHIIYIKTINEIFYTYLSHAKSLKLGVHFAITVPFSAGWLSFKCFLNSRGEWIRELPYSSGRRDVGGVGKSAGRLSIGLDKGLGFEALLQKRFYYGL